MAVNALVKKEAPNLIAVSPSDEVHAAGAQIYRNNCVICHGQPGRGQTDALALNEIYLLTSGDTVDCTEAGIMCIPVIGGN